MVFAEKVYNAMWDARAEYAQSTPDCAEEDCFQCCNNFVKHAHFPRTIRAARVIWGRQDAENFKVMIDIQLCPGCCVGPLKCIVTNDPDSPDMPGLMRTDHYSHQLELDGKRIKLEECFPAKDPAFRPVSSHVSGDQFILKRIRNSADLAVTFRNESRQLALYQPTGLSLPNNEHTVLLLKALSTHLAGKRLVVTVIKCAEFYVVDHMGRRQEQNSDLGSSGGNCSAEPGGFTPLCTIASPETWRREQGCAQRREQFRNIRERFYALVNLDRLMMDEAIRFFSDTFGCEYLKNYVGEITFFKSLPSMLGPELNSDTAVGMIVKGSGNDLPARPPRFSFSHLAMARDLFKGKHRFNAAQEPRFQVVLPRLRMRCQALRYSISQTLSVGLLELISTAYNEADQDYGRSSRRTDQARNHGNHNKKTSTRCMVQEIKDLQEKLDATDDEDEQRALEEDVTGKILWLCWCGMRSEVELLLPQIVDYIRNEGGVEGLLEIGGIIEATHSQPNDDQTHLRRIMADAGAGTSKYQLLLAAQATTILDDKFCS
ncbi:hypothetical protein EDC04DRAFT_2640530 [Pisolithus marmoratus]|nr:hypothetical protein EDC04DRAFT_2640530 [Pisolithus marmoratus]